MKSFNKYVIIFITLVFLTGISTSCSNTVTPSSTDDGTKYTVTFNSDGGTSVSQQKLKESQKASKPADPKKDGYAFDGWFIEDQLYDFNEEVSSNLTLKAKWTKAYTVSFDTDGGNTISPLLVREGQKATPPATPSKESYQFICWCKDGNPFDFNTTPINSDISLKAKWKELTYLVTFNYDNGSANTYQDIKAKALATEPELPKRSGYTFLGWFYSTDEEDKKIFINNNKIEGRKVLLDKSGKIYNINIEI